MMNSSIMIKRCLTTSNTLTRRCFGTGAKGARGVGWYEKYRKGEGGRHLQGQYFDRNSTELETINNTVFNFGNQVAYIDIEIENNTFNEGTTENNIHRITMELATAALPLTTTNFKLLCEDGLYNDTIVHRIQKDVGFCMGDIDQMKGKGGYCHSSLSKTGKLLETEPTVVTHMPGIVTMMSAGVDKIDSRFMIVTKESPQLDGRFLGFGRLLPESLETVLKLESTQRTIRGTPIAKMKIVSCGLLIDDDEEQEVA